MNLQLMHGVKQKCSQYLVIDFREVERQYLMKILTYGGP